MSGVSAPSAWNTGLAAVFPCRLIQGLDLRQYLVPFRVRLCPLWVFPAAFMLVSQSVSSAFTCMGSVFQNTDSIHCIMDLTFDQFPHLSTTSVIMAYGIQSYFVLGIKFSILFGSNRTSRPGRDTGKWLPVIPLPPLLKPN